MKPTAVHRYPAVSCITRDAVRRAVECASQQYLRPNGWRVLSIPRLSAGTRALVVACTSTGFNLGASTWNIFWFPEIDRPCYKFRSGENAGIGVRKKGNFDFSVQNTRENVCRESDTF